MTLVTSKELVTQAQAEHYAVGAFNAINMETGQAIVTAGIEENAPLIIQVTQTTLKYTDPEEVSAILHILAERAPIPIALHLDHGRTFETVMRFLKLGFTSVMIDGSLQPDGKTPRSLEENVELTRKVVEAAHALGVTVEGEIGTLGQIGVSETALTDPDQAAEFVENTGVDMLAVAIGTAHGLYRGTPVIDIDRVKAIRKKVGVPLVMHGGTGTPDEMVRAAVEAGIVKVNIDTQIRIAFYEAVRDAVYATERAHEESDKKGEPRKYDIRSILGPAREAMTAAVADRIRVFGAAGRAG
ncbi:MAG: class II fructose-bisphosphate aldolase [Armatimonadetes bacterium]|nr:class II fructose-bisphosphate aldolase [Armatimonadota bacterium]